MGRGARKLGIAAVVAGLTAIAVSLVECVLGLLLAGSAAPDSEGERAGRLFDLIYRLDGVTMLALAALALAGVGLVRRTVTTLAQAVLVSGPLLLVWVAGAGIALAWTGRSGAPA